MTSDRLSDLLVPNLIERFDAIPSETPLNFTLSKSELAYLIKSQYHLHAALSQALRALGPLAQNLDQYTALQAAHEAFQQAQTSLNEATNSLIARAVATSEGR